MWRPQISAQESPPHAQLFLSGLYHTVTDFRATVEDFSMLINNQRRMDSQLADLPCFTLVS